MALTPASCTHIKTITQSKEKIKPLQWHVNSIIILTVSIDF